MRRGDCYVLTMALEFHIECQRKKGRVERILKMQVEEESMKVGLSREVVLC